jgi:hypothetical protein
LALALALLLGNDATLAARTTTPVAGDVRAVAFSGDALTIAHLPQRGGLTVERLAAGAASQPLLVTDLRGAEDEVQLAGSSQALAVGLQADAGESFGPSRVLIGPPAGPLREVSVCPAGLLAPPVAVAGSQIAWRDGACGDPPESSTGITPAAIVVGAADPAITPARIALEPNVLPVSIVLAGAGGMVGALGPSFFAVDSEIRALSPLGALTPLLAERSAIVSPLGALTDGTRAFSLARLNVGDGKAVCPNSLFTIADDAAQRRALAPGGCPLGADLPLGPSSARVAGDRVYAVIGDTRPRSGADPPLTSLVSLRADGGARRVHASGSYRPPLGFAADGDRVAYWHRRCSDPGSDVVVVDGAAQDPGPSAIAACRARVLTRSALMRDGRISVRLRCAAGCRGVAADAGSEPHRRLRAFALQPGTHTLRLAVPAAARRRGRLRLELVVENGPARLAQISVRR